MKMTPNDEPSKKLGPPATKRPVTVPRSHHRLSSSHMPDRLKGGDDDQGDFAAPPNAAGTEGRDSRIPFGVFSFLAAQGTKSEYYPKIDEPPLSDSEGEAEGGISRLRFWEREAVRDDKEAREDKDVEGAGKERGRTRLRRRSHRRIFKRLSRSRARPQALESRTEPTLVAPGTVTTESKATAKSPGVAEQPVEGAQTSEAESSLLSTRLKKVFGLEREEKVLAEYQCWLMQSILLQGYMYVTERHICFYAYLPKKNHSVIKSGYLSKRGKQNPKYNRYWFALKGDVLSYYLDPSNLYFPSGHVDLRYAISANLADSKDKDNTKDFVVSTDNRTYQFRADSVPSAKEWVKTLQKVIFRSHNDGDSVKILVPIENVIDIEDNAMLDFAETCKLRVLESEDSFAIDEVCYICHSITSHLANKFA